MNPLYISTSSKIKLDHYRKFFNPLLYEVHSINLQLPEIQAIEPNQVVLAKLEYAARNTELRPLIVDDVGLSLPNFSGFPGALLKPILELGGLKLLEIFAHLSWKIIK